MISQLMLLLSCAFGLIRLNHMEIMQFLVSKNAFKQAQQNMGFRIFRFNGEKKGEKNVFHLVCTLGYFREKLIVPSSCLVF